MGRTGDARMMSEDGQRNDACMLPRLRRTHIDHVHLLFFFILWVIQPAQSLILPRQHETIGKQAKEHRFREVHERLALDDEACTAKVECEARKDSRGGRGIH